MKRRLRALLHRLGIDVVRYDGVHFPNRRRIELLEQLGVDLVLDVGASSGYFGRQLRRDGYGGRLVSFEPLSEAFERLHARADEQWECHHIGLGAHSGTAVLHRSANSWSSSLLPVTQVHLDVAPGAAYVADEDVPLARLDSFGFEGAIFLKIDAQGYELEVLRGAHETLRRTVLMELELSTTELYEGQPLLWEVLAELHERGFALAAMSPELPAPTGGAVLQWNGLLVRSERT